MRTHILLNPAQSSSWPAGPLAVLTGLLVFGTVPTDGWEQRKGESSNGASVFYPMRDLLFHWVALIAVLVLEVCYQSHF